MQLTIFIEWTLFYLIDFKPIFYTIRMVLMLAWKSQDHIPFFILHTTYDTPETIKCIAKLFNRKKD